MKYKSDLNCRSKIAKAGRSEIKDGHHGRHLKNLLTFTTLLANSADDKLVIFFLFVRGNRI